jgi:hypothetical protein
MVIAIYSPDGSQDETYVGNYAYLYVLNALQRIPGANQASIFGVPNYAMRIWLKPDRMSALGLTTDEVIQRHPDPEPAVRHRPDRPVAHQRPGGADLSGLHPGSAEYPGGVREHHPARQHHRRRRVAAQGCRLRDPGHAKLQPAQPLQRQDRHRHRGVSAGGRQRPGRFQAGAGYAGRTEEELSRLDSTTPSPWTPPSS